LRRAGFLWVLLRAPRVLVLASASRRAGLGCAGPSTVRLVARDEPVRDVLLRLGAMAHLNLTIGEDVHAPSTSRSATRRPTKRCMPSARSFDCAARAAAARSWCRCRTRPSCRSPGTGRTRRARHPQPLSHLTVTEGGSGNTLIVSGSDADNHGRTRGRAGLDVRDPRKPVTEALTLRAQPARPSRTACVRFSQRQDHADQPHHDARHRRAGRPRPDQNLRWRASMPRCRCRRPRRCRPKPSTSCSAGRRTSPAASSHRSRTCASRLRADVTSAELPKTSPVPSPDRRTRRTAVGTRYTQIYRLKNVDAQSVADLVKRASPKRTSTSTSA